jgi:hypothetical protein
MSDRRGATKPTCRPSGLLVEFLLAPSLRRTRAPLLPSARGARPAELEPKASTTQCHNPSRGPKPSRSKEVIEDSVAYLKENTTYKKIVVFIYDESASVQDHDIAAAALRELNHVIDVIVVSRPSQLPAAAADHAYVAPARAKRARAKAS